MASWGLEIDGEEYHNDPKAWQEDLRRDNVMTCWKASARYTSGSRGHVPPRGDAALG